MAKAPTTKVTAGDVQDLAVAVEQLTEEARLLRMALDEIRDDVVWATRQVLAAGYEVSGTPPPAQRDALAPHAEPQPLQSKRTSQPIESAAESGPYCCDRPNLRWNGDPDMPGVACENCGYVIAEGGSVVIWRDEPEESTPNAAEQSAEPEQRQGSLF